MNIVKNNKYRNEFSNVLNQETFEELEINIRKFSYPQKRSLTLSDINLKIKKGEFIAILGESGKGKRLT